MKVKASRRANALIFATATLAWAGCSSSDSGTSDADDKLDKTTIAVFIPTKANTYFAASLATIEAEAKDRGAKVQVFDAGFDPNKQYTQVQDAITTGRYKSMLIAPMDGPATASLVSEAADAGITVVGFNQPMGTDFMTVDSLAEGLDAQVLRPIGAHGEAIGEMTIEACKNLDPCKVAYLYIQKGSPPDTPLRQAFDDTIASSSNVEVVAEANSMATMEGGLTAAQDILTAHPDINVFVGSDQAILGAQSALDKGADNQPTFVGIGGSSQAVAQVEKGAFFGTSATVPQAEGRLAVESLAKALETGKPVGGVDPVLAAEVPADGRITAANLADFMPEFDG